MKILFGLLIAMACVSGGYAAMGGSLHVLFQPFEYVIIVGGAVGAFIISNPVHVLKDSILSFLPGRKTRRKKDDYLQLLSLIFMLLRSAAKPQTMKALEEHLDDPLNSSFFKQFPRLSEDQRIIIFICDYIRLISLGTKRPHELADLMDEEIDTLKHELSETPRALQTIADAFPALGIIAAIMGIVKTMGHIDSEPAVLGMMIGGALVGTATGIFLCYCVVGPMSQILQKRRDAEANFYQCVRAALIAHLNRCSPQVSVEYARKVITSDVRPSYFEVEDATNKIKTLPA